MAREDREHVDVRDDGSIAHRTGSLAEAVTIGAMNNLRDSGRKERTGSARPRSYPEIHPYRLTTSHAALHFFQDGQAEHVALTLWNVATAHDHHKLSRFSGQSFPARCLAGRHLVLPPSCCSKSHGSMVSRT